MLFCKLCQTKIPFEAAREHSAICKPSNPARTLSPPPSQSLPTAQPNPKPAISSPQTSLQDQEKKPTPSVRSPVVAAAAIRSFSPPQPKPNSIEDETLRRAVGELKVELAQVRFELPGDLKPVRIGPVTHVKSVCRLAIFDKLVILFQEKIMGFFRATENRQVLLCTSSDGLTFRALPEPKTFELNGPAFPDSFILSVENKSDVDGWSQAVILAKTWRKNPQQKQAVVTQPKEEFSSPLPPRQAPLPPRSAPSPPPSYSSSSSSSSSSMDSSRANAVLSEFFLTPSSEPKPVSVPSPVPSPSPVHVQSHPDPTPVAHSEPTSSDSLSSLSPPSSTTSLSQKEPPSPEPVISAPVPEPVVIPAPEPVVIPAPEPTVPSPKLTTHQSSPPKQVPQNPVPHSTINSLPPAAPEKTSKELKVLMVGGGVVGKSAIAAVFAKGVFPPEDQWIPSEIFQKTVHVPSEPPTHLNILDMAPDENRPEFAATFQEYMSTADCMMLVYSVCSQYSFNEASYFYNQIVSFRPNAPTFILVGNMIDDSERREVTEEEGENLAESLGCKFVEVSARTGDGLSHAFQMLTSEHIDRLTVLERQAEIDQLLQMQEEEEMRREEEERARIRMRERELEEQMKISTEAREKEQNDLIAEEMRRREAMKKAALMNLT